MPVLPRRAKPQALSSNVAAMSTSALIRNDIHQFFGYDNFLADRQAVDKFLHIFLALGHRFNGVGIGVGTVDSYISEAVAILGAPNRRRAAEMLFGGKDPLPPGKYEGELPGVAPGPDDDPFRGQGLQVGEWQVLLPFRHKGVSRNALGPIHRLFWFILLVLAAAASFGMLAIGLEVLSRFLDGD